MSGQLPPPGPPMEPSPDDEPAPAPGFAARPWVEPPSSWRPFDRVSLWAFVLACSALGGPVAVVLGIIGLRRTNDDAVAGRWAAITGVVLGLFSTLAVTAIFLGTDWFRDNFKPVSRVETGECVDISEEDGVMFYPQDCSSLHDGEVVAAGDFDAQRVDGFRLNSRAEFCRREIDEEIQAAMRTHRYRLLVYVDSDDVSWPAIGDAYACVLVSRDGAALREPIGAGR